MDLTGKNFLITGGTSVLGECLVREALAANARVFFTWHKNEAKARELEQIHARAIRLDMNSAEAVQAAGQRVTAAVRALHGLVHNAAAIRDATLENLSEVDWDTVMAANVKAPFILTRELMPALEKAKPGRVVALTSRAAVSGVYGASNYAASKAALEAWVKTLAREAGEKILVNAVNPGFMLSGMTAKVPEKAKEMQKCLSPLKRFSDPKTVAKSILSLLSDENTQITGQVLNFESRMPFMIAPLDKANGADGSAGSVLGAVGDGD